MNKFQLTRQLQLLRLTARRQYAAFVQPYHPQFSNWLRETQSILAGFKGDIFARSRYGVRIVLELPDDMVYASVCAFGLYETGTTELLRTLFRPNDVFVDVGANIGWHSLHFARFVPSGHCHAFEPLPAAIRKLARHISLHQMEESITVHPVALGDEPGEGVLYSFSGLPHAHSSFSRLGRGDTIEQGVAVTTLDNAVESGVVPDPNIIKVDVEGYELQVLHGANRLLKNSAPIWIFEMNEETSAAFGYSPLDLLHHIRNYAPYQFIRIPHAWGRAQPMQSTEDYRHGDTVACYIHDRHSERLGSDLKSFTAG